MSRIVIEDLPEVENLTPEEMAEIYGAGPKFRPDVESLEDRFLMSASPIQNLKILGTSGNDTITVDVTGPAIKINKNGVESTVQRTRPFLNLSIDGGAGKDVITLTGKGAGFNSDINLYGGAGNDILDASKFKGMDDLKLWGQAGNDSLLGSHGRDQLSGGAGNDTIDGRGGANKLYESGDVNFTLSDKQLTGLGTDNLSNITAAMLYGGKSDNEISASNFRGMVEIYGGGGNDLIYGSDKGPGWNELHGGDGDDWIFGGWQKHNEIYGGDGMDHLTGGQASDLIEGGRGNDALYGEGGADHLKGESGADWLYGGQGNDLLEGGSGDDYMDGKEGDDILRGEAGGDTLYGSEGNDILRGGSGRDVLWGGAGVDQDWGGPGSDVVDTDGGQDVWKDPTNEDRVSANGFSIQLGVLNKWLTMKGTLGDITSSSVERDNGVWVTTFQKGIMYQVGNETPVVLTLSQMGSLNSDKIAALAKPGQNLGGYKGPTVSVSSEGISVSDPNVDKAKEVYDKAQKAVASGQAIIDKGQTSLDQIAQFANDPIGSIVGAVSTNDYALVKAEYEAKNGQTAGVSNIYFSSKGFTDWASPETIAGWVAAGIGSGGTASAAIVEDIKSHLLKEMDGIVKWAGDRLKAEATNAVDQLVQALIKGENVKLGGVELSVKMVTVNYYYQIPGVKESRVTLPHLGFVIGVVGNLVTKDTGGSSSSSTGSGVIPPGTVAIDTSGTATPVVVPASDAPGIIGGGPVQAPPPGTIGLDIP